MPNNIKKEVVVTKEEVEKEFERAFSDYPNDQKLNDFFNLFLEFFSFERKFQENDNDNDYMLSFIIGKLKTNWLNQEQIERIEEYRKINIIRSAIYNI